MSVDSFVIFWDRYPLKVSKIRAQHAYQSAIKRATERQILDGLERYIASKPQWMNWAHPASWLNAGRWEDQPLTPISKKTATFGGPRDRGMLAQWLRECQHQPTCISSMQHEARTLSETPQPQNAPRGTSGEKS